jgi:O-acetyl-ADP-ribose deacetylase (regulator of RNase III)
VWTSSHGDLKQHYPQGIVHTVPPFYDKTDDKTSSMLLKKCYWNSLNVVHQQQWSGQQDLRVACPLLGAGCRGFPVDLAMLSAVEALTTYPVPKDSKKTHGLSLAFAIPSGEIREALSTLFDGEFRQGADIGEASS